MANIFEGCRMAKMTYNVPTDGGAQGIIQPAITEVIPTGSIITGVLIQPLSNFTTTSSPTMVITAGGVTISGSTPIASNATGLTTGGQDASWFSRVGAVTTAPYLPVKTTSAVPIKVTVGTADMIAGKFNVFVFYVTP